MDKKMSDEFNDLIKQGYSFDSPEMIKFFEKNVRTRAKSPYNQSNSNSNEKTASFYTDKTNDNNDIPKVRTRAKSPYNKSNSDYNTSRRTSGSYTNIRNEGSNYTSKPRTRSKANNKYYDTTQTYSNNQSQQTVNSKTRSNEYSRDYHSSSYKSYNKDTYSNTNDNSKFHIVIDPYKGNYSLLDSRLQLIDTIHKNCVANFLSRRFNFSKFKKQLNKDYRAYKKYCKRNKISLDPSFKKVNDHIKYCLSLCPDADYQILELLRNNIEKVAPSYGNYQTACAQYLHELAVDFPYPSRMPFDLNYACDGLTSNHRRIANTFGHSDNPVDTFKKYYLKTTSEEAVQEEFLKTPNTEIVPPKKDLEVAKRVKAPVDRDFDR